MTISKIVAKNPNQGLWILAAIYGFLSFLNGSQTLALGNRVHVLLILLLAVIVAPFWGMVVFGIWSWVVHLVGKMLKGQGSFAFVRAAFAWSCVPLSVNILLWVLLLIAFGGSLFQTMQGSVGPMLLLLFVLIAKVIVMVWSLVIYINALAEVQKYSVGRSIANIVLAWVAIAVLFALIWMGIGFLVHTSLSPSQAVFNLTLGMQV